MTLEGGTFPLPTPSGTHSVSARGGDYRSKPKRWEEILPFLVLGKSNKEIADTLFISERTVEDHVEIILETFRCSSRAQVIIEVLRNDLRPAAEVIVELENRALGISISAAQHAVQQTEVKLAAVRL